MYRAHESLSTPPIPRGGAAGHYPFKIDQLEYALHIGESGSVWLNLEGGVTRKGSANRNPCYDLFWDAPNFSDVDLGVNAFAAYLDKPATQCCSDLWMLSTGSTGSLEGERS